MRFDRVVLAAVVGLALAIAALSVASARLGPSVDALAAAQTLDGTAVNTSIGVTFTEPMDFQSVERSFRMKPRIRGDFSWSGNELFFIPHRNLAYGSTYTLSVGTGAKDKSGRPLSHAFHRSFTTQSQHLVYRGTEGAEAGRLILASITGKRQTLTDTDRRVKDYSVSFDRSLVVYVAQRADDRRADEIWLLSLADGSVQRVFRRPDWALSQPHFSPDGKWVVFLASNVLVCQKRYGCFTDRTSPLVYLLDLRTKKVKPFRAIHDVPITNFIDFSPAGQVAYTDLGSALTLAYPQGSHVPVHIPNRGNSLEFAGFDSPGDKAAFVGQTPNSPGGDILIYQGGQYLDVSKGVYDSSGPAFSTSGNQVAYSAYRGERGIEPLYGVNIYDFRSHKNRSLTRERVWSDWSPQWSSDGKYLAFIRSEPQEAMYMGTGEIWVAASNGKDSRPLGAVGTSVRWVS